jgi:CheY-like chemotaxis protein
MTDRLVVLVVEDEPLIRMDIADELSARGFKVFEAGNAREAIEILANNPDIQILFTDIEMPGGMDGLMLAAAVRDRWPPIRIIVTSGNRNVAESDMPSQSRFFGKPYRADALATAMKEIVA